MNTTSGHQGTRRQQKRQHPAIQHLSNGDIRRLARKGGVKRISSDVYIEVKNTLLIFLKALVGDAKVIMEYAGRSTLMALDIVYAIKRKGFQYLGVR